MFPGLQSIRQPANPAAAMVSPDATTVLAMAPARLPWLHSERGSSQPRGLDHPGYSILYPRQQGTRVPISPRPHQYLFPVVGFVYLFS